MRFILLFKEMRFCECLYFIYMFFYVIYFCQKMLPGILAASLDLRIKQQYKNVLSKLICNKIDLIIARRMRMVAGADKIAQWRTE